MRGRHWAVFAGFLLLVGANTFALAWISRVSKETDRGLAERQSIQQAVTEQDTEQQKIKLNGTIRCLLNAVNPDRCLRRQEQPEAKRGPLPPEPQPRVEAKRGFAGKQGLPGAQGIPGLTGT
jgi:hypothetical protein